MLGVEDTSGPAVLWRPKALSVDQKPEDAAERQRLEAAGGVVARACEEAPYRVFNPRARRPRALAMSRSIGDHELSTVGVTVRARARARVPPPRTLGTRASVAHFTAAHTSHAQPATNGMPQRAARAAAERTRALAHGVTLKHGVTVTVAHHGVTLSVRAPAAPACPRLPLRPNPP